MGALFRHELKHAVSPFDVLVLRQRLDVLLARDGHAGADGTYRVRSLYFDNLADKALREKLDGVNRREKWRLRLYDNDDSFIRLERKAKVNGLCHKDSVRIDASEALCLLAGDTAWMADPARPLLARARHALTVDGLRPRTVVDYRRRAWRMGPGNVRVTLDDDIRTGSPSGFLDPQAADIVAGDPVTVLEVKWDEFLPSVVRDAVQLPGRRSSAFSKYAASRAYG